MVSGIAGVLHFDGAPVVRAHVDRMLERLARRGPDDAGSWVDTAVGLGHRMLWTTPESLHEKLPLVSSSGRIVITSDGRIDNRDELLAELDFGSRAPAGVADSELILAAYQKWGENCPDRLLGDFVFAIWDKEQRKLFCARDHFGIKPFYYYLSNAVFAFGSEIKALLCLPQVRTRISEVQIARFLSVDYSDKTSTYYDCVYRLPPAHALTVHQNGSAQVRPYWTLDIQREIHLGSDEEYAAKFRELFTEAVRCRLRSAYPVGSMLSGGMDSSSIACVARDILVQEGKAPLPVFSAVMPDVPETDESAYIEAVVADGNVEPQYLRGDLLSPLNDLENMLNCLDEPQYAANLFLEWGLRQQAQALGVRVLLNGFDGDTTVSHGLTYLVELGVQGRWEDFAAEVRGLTRTPEHGKTVQELLNGFGYPALSELAKARKWRVLLAGIQTFHRHFGRSRRRLVMDYMVTPVLPSRVRRVIRRLRRRKPPQPQHPETQSLINPAFASSVGYEPPPPSSLPDAAMTEKENHYRRLNWGVITKIIEMTDITTSCFGIEPRFPFMDKRLVEFCFAIPPEQKLHQGWTRLILRRAMEGILPEKVQWRPGKADQSANFSRALLQHERQRIEAMLEDRSGTLSRFVNMPLVQNTYEEFAARGKHENLLYIWYALVLELWLSRQG